jgi:small subunit ribosomal protein S17
MTDSTKTSARRRLIGIVTSTKMTKTVSVRVDRTVIHPKYGKRYAVSAKYLAHNESPDIHEGDKVVIEETRPLSALKRWRVISKA